MLLATPLASHAQEAKPIAAQSREKAAADSAAANAVKGSPAAAETKKEEAKPLSDAQKSAAIKDAEGITAFNPDAVVGAAKDWQLYYQPAASPPMIESLWLSHYVLGVAIVITLFVLALLFYVMVRFNKKSNPKPQTFTHNKTVEVIWTVIPIIILVTIAIPSLRLHYNYYNNETIISNADLTIKVVGHQWYWSYEYPDEGIAFDSNIKPDAELAQGEPRLLTVDNPIVVPVGKTVRVQITAADVIHAWAVPSFAIKQGAVPGRLNETWFKAEKEGIYYGQCSVLCGKSHGFMPIQVVVVSQEKYDAWVKGAKLKFAANNLMQFASLN